VRLPARRRLESGFTLVEILVVLAILATLIGLVAALIPKAMVAKQKVRANTLVMNIGAALNLLKTDNDQFGRYPLSRLRDMKIGKSQVGKEVGQQNDINAGIEAVYFLLNNPDIQITQITSDAELIGNSDNDAYRAAKGTASDLFCREYLDPWGQPLAYFHCNDYKDPKGLTDLVTTDGRKISVKPKRMKSTAGGAFKNPNSFQLFSVGPNGEQDPDDAEESDDIEFEGQ
jgi:prepilin-type N-terminal cleavage/methylation domain-containing protein